MKSILLALVALSAVTPVRAADLDDFVTSAVLDGSTLRITIDSPEPLSADSRQPLVQVDLPAGVAPVESALEPDELKGKAAYLNHLADFPYGRVVASSPVEIPLRIDEGATGSIGINVTTYLDGTTPAEAVFVRRRLELAVEPQAVAEVVQPTRTAWGPTGRAHVGDAAPDFDLPSGDGERLVLAQEIAEKRPIFLLTYRSDW